MSWSGSASFACDCSERNSRLNLPRLAEVFLREGGQQAALAGTGRADQIDDLAAIDVERQILEDGAV